MLDHQDLHMPTRQAQNKLDHLDPHSYPRPGPHNTVHPVQNKPHHLDQGMLDHQDLRSKPLQDLNSPCNLPYTFGHAHIQQTKKTTQSLISIVSFGAYYYFKEKPIVSM
jgi:hypothetical protein